MEIGVESNKRHSNLKSGPVTYCISLLLVVHPIWTNQFGVSITSDYAAGLLVSCGTPNVGSAAHWLYVFIVNTMAFLRGGGETTRQWMWKRICEGFESEGIDYSKEYLGGLADGTWSSAISS